MVPMAPVEPARELVDSKHVPNLPSITDEQARAALMAEAQKKGSALSKKAIKQMSITKIEYSFVHAVCIELILSIGFTNLAFYPSN